MNYRTSTSNIILHNLTGEQFAKVKHPIQRQDETQQGHVGFLLQYFPNIDNVLDDLLGADRNIEAATVFLSMQKIPPVSWATRPAIGASVLHASTSSGSAAAASSSMARSSYAATLPSSSACSSAGAASSSESHGSMQKGTTKTKMGGNSTKKSKSKNNNKKRPTTTGDLAVAVASIRRLTKIHTCRRKRPGKIAPTNINRACHLPITHNKDDEFDTFMKRLEDSGLFASTW